MRISITFWGWNEAIIDVLNSNGEVVKRLLVEPVMLYMIFHLLRTYTYDLFIASDTLIFARVSDVDMCSWFVTIYREARYDSILVGTVGELISQDGRHCGYIAPEHDATKTAIYGQHTVYTIKPSTPKDSGRLVVSNRQPKLTVSFECGAQTPAVCLSQVSIRYLDDATAVIDIPYDAYYMDTYNFSKIRIGCTVGDEKGVVQLYRIFSGGRYLVKCYDQYVA